ncbi:MAG TPA: hypothetical protein VGM92_10450, partial [Candidatus Kapabacteria bacterium]
SISFQNLPEHYEQSSETWDRPSNTDVTNVDSGNDYSFAGNWTFQYQDSSFSMIGDTLSAYGLRLVADQTNGILKMLQFYYVGDEIAGDGYLDTTYGLDCALVPFALDTSNQIVVKVSGAALQTALSRCFYDNYETTDRIHISGSSRDHSNTYLDTAIGTSSLTIRFIP